MKTTSRVHLTMRAPKACIALRYSRKGTREISCRRDPSMSSSPGTIVTASQYCHRKDLVVSGEGGCDATCAVQRLMRECCISCEWGQTRQQLACLLRWHWLAVLECCQKSGCKRMYKIMSFSRLDPQNDFRRRASQTVCGASHCRWDGENLRPRGRVCSSALSVLTRVSTIDIFVH